MVWSVVKDLTENTFIHTSADVVADLEGLGLFCELKIGNNNILLA
jgi:hypothetical protein